MGKTKIKKANIIDSIRYKTLPEKTLLRYCLSFFISGLIIIIVSSKVISSPIQNTLQVISSFLIIVGIYLFPYFEFDVIDKFLSNFLKYMGLLLITLILSPFWFELCSIETTNISVIIFVILASIIEAILLVSCINYTLKPIIGIASKISTIIKEKATENESIYITYLKTFSANASIIISFLLSLITLITTINGLINPEKILELIGANIT